MKRVTLRVESLDGRILPGGSSGAIDLSPPTSPGLGSKLGGVVDGIQVNGGGKLGASVGTNSVGHTDTGVELFGGSKVSTASGQN
jgi:hypothetical protein